MLVVPDVRSQLPIPAARRPFMSSTEVFLCASLCCRLLFPCRCVCEPFPYLSWWSLGLCLACLFSVHYTTLSLNDSVKWNVLAVVNTHWYGLPVLDLVLCGFPQNLMACGFFSIASVFSPISYSFSAPVAAPVLW